MAIIGGIPHFQTYPFELNPRWEKRQRHRHLDLSPGLVALGHESAVLHFPELHLQ